MKQILLTFIEDTKDIENFVEYGTDYAHILGRNIGIDKGPEGFPTIKYDLDCSLPSRALESPLQIGKAIWVVKDDGVYPSKIAFLGERSLLVEDLCTNGELQYSGYGSTWFDDMKDALKCFAADHDCEVSELIEDVKGVWRALEEGQIIEEER